MISTAWDVAKRCATAVRRVNRVLALGMGLSVLLAVSAIYSHRAHNDKIVSERFDALTAQTLKQMRRQMEMYEKGIRLYRYGAGDIAEQAPGSFKDISQVVQAMRAHALATLVVRLKPIATLKG